MNSDGHPSRMRFTQEISEKLLVDPLVQERRAIARIVVIRVYDPDVPGQERRVSPVPERRATDALARPVAQEHRARVVRKHRMLHQRDRSEREDA